MQLGSILPNRRQTIAQWQRGFILVVCVAMLPLPVPKMHRHEEIDSRGGLACHLVRQHDVALQLGADLGAGVEACDATCHDPTLNEPHWHFVLPAQYRDAGESEDEVPPAENAFLAFADDAATTITAPHRQVVELVCLVSFASCYIEMFDDRPDRLDRCRLAADAVQVSRCACSCVMQC